MKSDTTPTLYTTDESSMLPPPYSMPEYPPPDVPEYPPPDVPVSSLTHKTISPLLNNMSPPKPPSVLLPKAATDRWKRYFTKRSNTQQPGPRPRAINPRKAATTRRWKRFLNINQSNKQNGTKPATKPATKHRWYARFLKKKSNTNGTGTSTSTGTGNRKQQYVHKKEVHKKEESFRSGVTPEWWDNNAKPQNNRVPTPKSKHGKNTAATVVHRNTFRRIFDKITRNPKARTNNVKEHIITPVYMDELNNVPKFTQRHIRQVRGEQIRNAIYNEA